MSHAKPFSITLPNHITLKGLSWGENVGVPTLAVHGWLDNSATFSLLGRDYPGYLVAIDLPGHGLSGHRPAGVRYHIIDFVDDILAAADQLGFDKFNLLGHSMGAALASYVAAIAPDRIQNLLLIDGLGTLSSPADNCCDNLRQSVLEMSQPQVSSPTMYETFDRAVAVRARFGLGGALSVEAASYLCERGLVKVDDGFFWLTDPRLRMTSAIRLTEEMVMALLQRIEAPTLLLRADSGLFSEGCQYESRFNAVQTLCCEFLAGNHHLHLEEATYQKVLICINSFLSK